MEENPNICVRQMVAPVTGREEHVLPGVIDNTLELLLEM